uniref:CSON015086 protein n=1 Tax=Culicoides sonorensis TaxID=179676 RepID=A0A336MF68_CULSO
MCGLSRPEPADDNYQNDADDDYQDDDQDYNQEYDDGDSKDQSSKQVGEKKTAYFLEDRMSKSANISQTVALACPVKNLDEKNHVIMWYNYTSMLYQKKVKHSKDPRISLDENFSLHIKNVQVTDTNEYFCKIYPENINHTISLKVFGPLTHVSILANKNNVTSQKLTFDVRQPSYEFNGANLVLECKATGGNPAGRVTWSKKGENLEHGTRSHHIHVYNNTLEIRHITRKQAGVYQCLAGNGFGKPVHAHVELVVTHKPQFLKEETAVNTNIDETAELHCKFESNPKPEHVHWYKNEGSAKHERIHESDKYKIRNHYDQHGGVSTTTLEIRRIDQQDLNEYTCEVQNAVGKARSKIFLALTPSTVQLLSHSYKGGVLHTKWETHSHQPLTELNVMTRGSDGKWDSHNIPVTDAHKPRNNVWTIPTDVKLPSGDYEVQARAKNSEGWSAINSETHKFNLLHDTEEVQVAQIGGTGGSQSISRASACILGVFLSIVLFF